MKTTKKRILSAIIAFALMFTAVPALPVSGSMCLCDFGRPQDCDLCNVSVRANATYDALTGIITITWSAMLWGREWRMASWEIWSSPPGTFSTHIARVGTQDDSYEYYVGYDNFGWIRIEVRSSIMRPGGREIRDFAYVRWTPLPPAIITREFAVDPCSDCEHEKQWRVTAARRVNEDTGRVSTTIRRAAKRGSNGALLTNECASQLTIKTTIT
jgi:hypothetical protein